VIINWRATESHQNCYTS